jgi:hypothetical protein
MTTVLSYGIRKIKKTHSCFHCYRKLAIGEKCGYQSNVGDGSVYTIYWHIDCAECAEEDRAISGSDDYEDGFQPLRDEWVDSGDYKRVCDAWRGFYPHVVARMELTDQLRSA